MTQPLDADALRERLLRIAAVLREHEALWRGNAFRDPALAWEAQHPGLAAAMRRLSLDEAQCLHREPARAAALMSQWLPEQPLAELLAMPRWPQRPLSMVTARLDTDVPGRKWRQVEAFAAALVDQGLPFVEWCAGKAHLGRLLSACHGHRPVRALEIDPPLVAAATALARRTGLPVTPGCCDVLAEGAGAELDAGHHLLMLHACGDLHRRGARLAIARAVPAIACAPCCFHLGAAEAGAGLSHWVRAQAIVLQPTDLRTAVQETVTAGERVRRQRRRVQEYQLGFDALQRELRGQDSYLPLPALPMAWLERGFAAYCAELARRTGVVLPPALDLAGYERLGRERFRTVSALDLVRHRFRRLLELWLVGDLALLLAENGYAVAVGEFCDRALTPRNLLIQAQRAA